MQALSSHLCSAEVILGTADRPILQLVRRVHLRRAAKLQPASSAC